MGLRRSYVLSLSVSTLFCLVRSINGDGPEVRGTVRGTVELDCPFPPSDSAEASPESPRVLEWVRRGLHIPVLIQFGSYAPRVHPQYEGRVSLVGITTLRLEGLKLEDQGLYECRSLVLDKPTEELGNGTGIILSVIAPPTFTRSPPPVLEGLVGSPLSLACAAVGNPLPVITWLKDGRVLQGGSGQEQVLSMPAASAQSAGRYVCHASNSEGNTTLETQVKIKGPPVITVAPKNTSLNVSQDALLLCRAAADPSNMTFVWLKGGENVYHVESLKSRVKIMVDGTLLISSLTPEDSGNYTCAPTNGLLVPPTASAVLTVMHPAQVLGMPEETYLPAGMSGMVNCSSVAQPPLLRVLWTKDGEPLDLSSYPGWTVTPEGTLLMATVNDDAVGVYTCTPYNSYNTMGPSGPTQVILQDPPSFSIAPEKKYQQKVGRTLLIPCQGNNNTTVKVVWTKVDLARRISYSIRPDGSLLLRPLAKDHHGKWECALSNRVASVKAYTQISVLGTSPHAATSLSISPGVKQANISWEAGFDGGSAQTFSVWVKNMSARNSEGKQEWFSVPVPPRSGHALLVSGLSPATDFQFSVLSHNKVGTGPFSEIATARTLDATPPRGQTVLLSAYQGSAGIVLQWSLAEAQNPPVSGFVLQSRTKQGDWLDLDQDISANTSQIVVPSLHKDCVYELRLLTRRGELLSEPSPSVNVSTAGMEMYPLTSRLLESPEPLLAGILGGVGFMCLALVLLLGSACLISHRRNLRRRKKNEPPPAIYKCPPSIKMPSSSSPDSVLKKSLLPASVPRPTTSSTISSFSMQADSSFFNNEIRNNKQQLYSNHTRSLDRFKCSKSSRPVTPSVEMISRGPDGRFVMLPFDTDSKKSLNYNTPGSLSLEQRDRPNPPFVLSVDLPPCKRAETNTKQTSDVVDHKGLYNGFADLNSMCSNSSLASVFHKRALSPTFPVLPHIRSGLCQPSTTASALVLQMEHEREKGNLSRCLQLAQEREELARELEKYSLYRGSYGETDIGQPESEKGDNDGYESVREFKSSTLPCRHRPRYRESFASSCLSSSVHGTSFSPSVPANPFYLNRGNQHPTLASTGQIPLVCEGADHSFKGGLPPPHLSATQSHERVQELPEGYDNFLASSSLEMQTNVPSSEAWRLNREEEEEFPRPTKRDVGIEMSVDEPEFNDATEPARAKLHLRIGSSLPRRGRFEEMGRSTSFHYCDKSSKPELRRVVSQGSKLWDSKQQSLHSTRQQETNFLTPDAWIESLSQEKLSVTHPRHPEPLSTDHQSSYTSKYSTNIQSTYHSPPRRSSLRPVQNPIFLDDHKTRRKASVYQEAMQKAMGYLEGTKESSSCFEPDNNPETQELEADVYEGVPEGESSYSSFASSGRGSMEPANGRSSLCRLSTNLPSSTETAQEDGQAGAVDKYSLQMEHRQRKASVDENYEWDEAEICSQPADNDGLLPPLSEALRRHPRTQFSATTLGNFRQNSFLPGHPSNRPAEPEPDTVLF
ncbi:protein turtle homolog A-like isoform X2 [Nerophis ophidion]|uniref:protein turtle homolog A-like isoform X2 n=1 Tax=Nerophis ophidion TaxID=159077 RepID=UPI002ADFA87E|nr:protein turtle homolog A-like isoform X2 [Nerophis ophidion]